MGLIIYPLWPLCQSPGKCPLDPSALKSSFTSKDKTFISLTWNELSGSAGGKNISDVREKIPSLSKFFGISSLDKYNPFEKDFCLPQEFLI